MVLWRAKKLAQRKTPSAAIKTHTAAMEQPQESETPSSCGTPQATVETQNKKRPASDESSDVNHNVATTHKKMRHDGKQQDDNLLDAAAMFYKPGDRLEVQWDICNNEDESKKETRWWGATLLPYAGGNVASQDGQAAYGTKRIAIRTLLYDAYPEGGFPESSQEEVVFLARHKLLRVDNGEELDCRVENSASKEENNHQDVQFPATVAMQEGLRQVLDGVMAKVLQAKGAQFGQLDAASQAYVAGRVARDKERLLDALSEHVDSKDDAQLTSQDIKQVVAKTFGK